MSTTARFYPIGTPGQPWGATELAEWRAQQRRQRSWADEVGAPIEKLRARFEVETYGEVSYEGERFPLVALRNRWTAGRPLVLVTGGVHGYETSGVQGALRFLDAHAAPYFDRVNLLVVPCVSPWAYERVQRWNFDAVDPNRSFREPSRALESSALMHHIAKHIAPLGQVAAHVDLHETTDTDETEFRPAKAARDGDAFEPGTIPDGFYLVDDTEAPQPGFQQAIIDAVARVTHIALPDAQGNLIGSPLAAHGVIRYPLRELALCTSITGARYTTTTEVYPDSPRTSPEACIVAQVAAVCAALDFVIEHH